MVIIESEVLICPVVVIFFRWLCAWGGCNIISCRIHVYHGTAGFYYFYYCAVLWCAQTIEYIMVRWLYSFVCTLHYLIIIIIQTYLNIYIYQTSKMFVRYLLSCVSKINASPWTKWLPFRRRYFQMHFREWKVLFFYQNFTEVCSLGSNWDLVSVGSGNGLAPKRRLVIIWTNADPVHWRIYAALGGYELSQCAQLSVMQQMGLCVVS